MDIERGDDRVGAAGTAEADCERLAEPLLSFLMGKCAEEVYSHLVVNRQDDEERKPCTDVQMQKFWTENRARIQQTMIKMIDDFPEGR